MVVFFFKQKTAYEMRISDWSSDVCSSDLILGLLLPVFEGARRRLDLDRASADPEGGADLSRPCDRPLRPSPAYQLQQPRLRGAVRRGEQRVGRHHRGG